ncbi:MAG TPA: helix-turn-helix domain-containing protein [Gemmatimonadaceae bacterium]|nr:helix-turn-helix domain-containing protein [Gemmatimonadaceae bacterium]
MPKSYDLSPKDAAAILGVHEDTLKRWADEGKVECWTTPGGWRRFAREDVEALLSPASSPATEQAS